LLLGDGFRFYRGLDVACEVGGDEGADGLFGEGLGLVEGVLQVLGGVLDREGGPGADFEVEVLGVLAERLGINRGNVDLALVLGSDGLEGCGERGTLFGSFGEDVSKREASLDVLISFFV